MKIAAGNGLKLDGGDAAGAAGVSAGCEGADFASFLVRGGTVFPMGVDTAVPCARDLQGVAAGDAAPAHGGQEAVVGLGGATDEVLGGGVGVRGTAKSKVAAGELRAGPKRQNEGARCEATSNVEVALPALAMATPTAVWSFGVAAGGLRGEESEGAPEGMRVAGAADRGVPEGVADDGRHSVGDVLSHEPQAASQMVAAMSADALVGDGTGTATTMRAETESESMRAAPERVGAALQQMDANAMSSPLQENSLDTAHALLQPADTTYIPTETFVTPLVASPTVPPIFKPGAGAGRVAISSGEPSFLRDDDHAHETNATMDAAASSFMHNGRGDAHEGLNLGTTRGLSGSGSSSHGGDGTTSSAFGLMPAGEPAARSPTEHAGAETQRPPAHSFLDESALERSQTAGVTRALGSALQSSLGVGVQTESFGRVTIHTATEGTQLRAELTLEDGRQSATLVSHVPAVEQRLTQHLGLEAAVRVSTGGGLSAGGGDAEGRRDAPPHARRESYAATSGANARGVAEMEAAGIAGTVTWRRDTSSGRLDVTV